MMRRTLILTGLVGLVGAATLIGGLSPAPTPVAAPAASGSWSVDPVHSSMVFRLKHMDTTYFYGQFNELTGTIAFDESKPEASTMTLSVAIDSVDTHNPNRNNHLKSQSFFNAKEFPTATFTSTAWKKSGDNTFDVTGDLTIHGVKKPITIKLEKTGQAAQGPMHVPIIGFATEFTINRDDFGITYMPDILGKEVKLMIGIEAGQK